MVQFPHRRTFSEPARRTQSWAAWAPDPCEFPSEENSPADLKLFMDLPELKEEPGLFGPPTPPSEEDVRVFLEGLGIKTGPSPVEKEVGLGEMHHEADNGAREADSSPRAEGYQVEAMYQEIFGIRS